MKRLVVLDIRLADGVRFDFDQLAPIWLPYTQQGEIAGCPTTAVLGATSMLTASWNVIAVLVDFGLSVAQAEQDDFSLQEDWLYDIAQIRYFSPAGRVYLQQPMISSVFEAYNFRFDDSFTWTEPGRWEVVGSWTPLGNFPHTAITSTCVVNVTTLPPKLPVRPPAPPPKLPVPPPAPPPVPASLTLSCPADVPSADSGRTTVTGALSPALAGSSVTITYTPQPSQITFTPPPLTDTTSTDANGDYTDTATLIPGLRYSAQSSWNGDAGHTGALSATCGPFTVSSG